MRRPIDPLLRRSGWLPSLALLLTAGCTAGTPPPAPEPEEVPETPAEAPEESVVPGLNDTFLDPELDVDSFVDRFEGESREIAAQRDGLMEILEIAPGDRVADVGAGTGLFLAPLSAAAGPEGSLFAVDISPGFIEHLDTRISEEGLTNASTVLCTERSTELPEGSVDVVFVCDTYHHFGYPASTLASIRRALVPGGRLVVVDFERIPGVTREWLLEHVRAGKETFRAEIEEAGFELVDEPEVEGLEENYVLRFRRP